MKKSLIALAILGGAANAALAQTNVSIYGLVDAGIVVERGGAAGSVTKLGSGIASGSRLGFKGSEDLGGGLSALFALENGFQADTGAAGQGGLLFGRQAFVGLSSTAGGTVMLGRQYTPHYLTTVFMDPFSSGTAGDTKNLFQAVGSGGRMDNSIRYVSPVWNGLSGELAYAFGETAGDTKAGRQIGAMAGYASGPLAVRLAYHNKNNDTAAATGSSTRNSLIAATYDLKVVKIFAGYGVNKGPASSPLRNTANPFALAVAPTAATVTRDSTDALVGVSVPFGPHTLLGSYIHKNDKTAANRDADQVAVGYRYALSKRTDLYTVYARMNNKNGASYTVGNASDGGSGDKALNVGIRHTF